MREGRREEGRSSCGNGKKKDNGCGEERGGLTTMKPLERTLGPCEEILCVCVCVVVVSSGEGNVFLLSTKIYRLILK